MASQVVKDSEKYGVTLEPANVSLGQPYWRAIRVHHLTPQENQGEHHIRVDAVDEYGEMVVGTKVCISWQGGEEELTIEGNGSDEPGVTFPVWKGQVCNVQLQGLPSDMVANLHTDHPDEGSGNSRFHHSFHLVFQRAVKKVFSHYVLFGSPDDSQMQANLLIALGYILRFKPAFGFRVEEAELSERVTIIGGPGSISLDLQDRLEEAGCWVHRIEGDSRAVDRVLGELLRRGTAFPQ